MPRQGVARRKPSNDSGMVTVEAGIALAAFTTVLALALGAVSAAIDQLRCTDAAREAARLAARGETERAESVARRIAPEDAVVEIRTTGEEVHVSISAEPVAGWIPGLELHADAYAISEPTSGAHP
jgi:Flp pilus assembly protein TadG